MSAQHTPESAASDLRRYARAMRLDQTASAVDIERRWGLYGYAPQIVSEVLAAVATGLPLDAAIKEVTR